MGLGKSFDIRYGLMESVAEQLVGMDVKCLNCGYDLRMQRLDGACPECGTPVRVSLRADRLFEASPAYRWKLMRGAVWLKWGVGLTLIFGYLGMAIGLVGLWRLTAAEPGRHEPVYDQRLRWLARSAFTIGWAGSTLGFGGALGLLLINRAWLIRFSDWQPVDAVLVALNGAMFIGLLAFWEYLGGLSRRMESPKLVRRCVRMRWVWVIGLTLMCSLALGTSMANWLYATRWIDPTMTWQAAGGVVTIVLMILISIWVWGETLRLAHELRIKLIEVADEQPEAISGDWQENSEK